MGRPATKKIKELTKEKFKSLYFQLTQHELAAALGVSQPTVVYWAKKFGFQKTRSKRLRIK